MNIDEMWPFHGGLTPILTPGLIYIPAMERAERTEL